MHPLNVYEIEHQRRFNLEREAAQERLLKVALSARVSRPALHRHLLTWSGRRLVVLGTRLLLFAQERDRRTNTVYNGVNF